MRLFFLSFLLISFQINIFAGISKTVLKKANKLYKEKTVSKMILSIDKNSYDLTPYEKTNFNEICSIIYDGHFYMKIEIESDKLLLLNDILPKNYFVRFPYKPSKKSTTAQSIPILNVDDIQNICNNKGAGMKIAVLDFFSDWNISISNGDLPSNVITESFGSIPFGQTGKSDHGTNCAEIIYDIAPEAQLYLLQIEDEISLEQAVAYCIMHEIDIISFSIGFDNHNFSDGSGSLCAIVQNASNNGILWVGAAGNEGINRYWFGPWSDDESDDILNFDSYNNGASISTISSFEITVSITWSGNKSNQLDLDIVLFKWDPINEVYVIEGDEIEGGAESQDGTTPYHEEATITFSENEDYIICIICFSDPYNTLASTDVRFYSSIDGLFDFCSSAYSLTTPADSAFSISVGAIHQNNYLTTAPILDYSSRGPTSDGRIKPDLCAPSEVQTSLTSNFNGTSAATPHIAGILALLKCANPNKSNEELKTLLYGDCVDLGALGNDATFGKGKIIPNVLNYSVENIENNSSGCNISYTKKSFYGFIFFILIFTVLKFSFRNSLIKKK